MATYSPPEPGDRAERMEWTGTVWTVVCPECDKPMADHDPDGWLACEFCGLRATEAGRR